MHFVCYILLFIDDFCQLRVMVELVWPLVLFLILMWVKMDNEDLRDHIHECMFCVFYLCKLNFTGCAFVSHEFLLACMKIFAIHSWTRIT